MIKNYLNEIKIYNELTFFEYIKNKKIGIWGTGEGAKKVINLLNSMGLKNEIYFDSNPLKHSKTIYSPEYLKEINKREWFIIIASVYYNEIKNMLEIYGFEEYTDFIDGIDIENALLSYKYRNNKAPILTFQDLEYIATEMKNSNIEIENLDININEVKKFEKEFNFSEAYSKNINNRYFRKVIEYYISHKLLNLQENFRKNEIYIDVAACTSPWTKILKTEKGINAYAIDLEKNELYKELDYYRIENAIQMSFEDNSVNGMSIQSSYEMFQKDDDIKFLKEAGRILKPGGKVVILPLYMYTKYISIASPKYYKKGFADVGAEEYIRIDCSEIQTSRFYDVTHLKNRIIDEANKYQLKAKIYVLPNDKVEKDGNVYLKFVLQLEKL